MAAVYARTPCDRGFCIPGTRVYLRNPTVLLCSVHQDGNSSNTARATRGLLGADPLNRKDGNVLVWLLLYFSHAAPRWVLALGSCVGRTALLKVVFYGCPPIWYMHSPSGHTSLSTLIYGALTLVAATAWPAMRSALVIGGGTALILAIGVSRLLLDAHSVAEVSLGLVIGTVSLAGFSQKYLQVPNMKVWPLLFAAV